MSVSNNRPLRSTTLFDLMAAQFLPNEHHYNSRMGGGWGVEVGVGGGER